MANHKLLSGRVKVTPAANVAADRYNYLGLEQAEPNLGVANADGFVLTYNTNSPGGRLWQSSSLLSGGLVAQSAFQTANNAEALSTSAYIHANAAFDKANTVGLHANAAFTTANTKYSSSGGTITGDVLITGNLSVEGTTLTVNVTTLYVEDSIIQLANGNITDTIDIGFIGHYSNGTANVHTGLIRHAVDDTYYLFKEYSPDITNIIDVANPSFKIATLSANLTANSVLIRGLDPLTQANTADQRAVTSGAYANSAYIHANAAFAAANTVSGGAAIDNVARLQANSSYIHANAAFAAANSANITAQAAFAAANNAIDTWVRDAANSASSYANGAFAAANTADQKATSSGSYANGAFVAANTADQRAVTSGAYANSSYLHANAAFAEANLKYSTNGGTISGDVTVTGNLTVSGQTTYANSTVVNLGDAVITLNADIPQGFAPTENAGIEIDRGSSDNVSLLWNETSDKWTFTNDGTNYSQVGSAAAESYANAAFAAANSAASSSTDTFARTQANASFITANSASSYANGAFAAANTADQRAVTSGAYANAAFGVANSASSYANGAFVAANTADQRAVTSGAYANAAFGIANSASSYANGAFGVANSASSYANGAFVAANTADQRAVTSGSYANSAYQTANSAASYANGAFASSNTRLSTSGGTISGDLVVTGNLSVEGATVTVNVTTLAIEDSIIQLAKNNTGDSIDIGFLGHYNNGSANIHTGLFRRAADDKYYLFENWNGEPTGQTIDISNPTFTIATLSANLTANSVIIRGLDPLTQANGAFGVANSASSYANGAFAAANTADQKAVTSGSYANSAYIHANAAFAVANSTSVTAQAAFNTANNAVDTFARIQANAAFDKANTAEGTVGSLAYAHANSSYLHANAAFAAANTAPGTVGQAAFNHANGAFALANSGGSQIYVASLQNFSSNGQNTTFTLSTTPTSANQLFVYVDGIYQQASAYTLTNNVITLSEALDANAVLEVRVLANTTPAHLNNQVDTFTGTGACTTFTLTSVPRDKNLTTIIVGGVPQLKSAYNISGSSLVFSGAPANGASIEVSTYSGGGSYATSFTSVIDTFAGDNSTTTFTLSTLPQSENQTFAFLNGVYQQKNTYSLSGANITFTGTATTNDTIEVVTVAGSEMNVTSARYNSRVYTGTGACTQFTISSSHTANSVLVFENGICQEPITDYSVSGTTLTFTTAPTNGVKIQIRELPV